jgi:hypothetical protein
MKVLRDLLLRFLNVVAYLLVTAVSLMLVYTTGAFVSNIVNTIMTGEYVDITIGCQIVLVIIALVWLPLLIINAVKRR